MPSPFARRFGIKSTSFVTVHNSYLADSEDEINDALKEYTANDENDMAAYYNEDDGIKDKCQYRQELTSTGDVITTVGSNPDAIGYASLASVKDTVKALTVGGVAPSEATVKDGSYVVQRPFVLVTKDGTKLSDNAQKFFDYITSDAASQIISKAGAVPVK